MSRLLFGNCSDVVGIAPRRFQAQAPRHALTRRLGWRVRLIASERFPDLPHSWDVRAQFALGCASRTADRFGGLESRVSFDMAPCVEVDAEWSVVAGNGGTLCPAALR